MPGLRLRLGSTLVLLLFGASASAQVASGTYVGDGNAGRPIFVGFQPNVVIVRVDYTEATFPPECGGVGLSGNDCSAAVIKTSTMIGANSKPMRGTIAPIANMITSIDPTGFTVGNDERVNGRPALCGGVDCTYYWVAIKAGPNVKVGTYSGNGVCGNADTQAITGVGFQPEYVVSMPRDTNWMLWRSNQDANTYQYNAGGSLLGIASLDANGFTVSAVDGGGHCMNGIGITYDYVAFNEAAGQIKVSSYPGTGAGQSIVGLGFTPRYVITKALNPASNDPIQRSDAMPGATSLNFRNASVANGITSLLPDGFQLGTNGQVNSSGTSYAYVAFGALGGCCALTTSEGAGSVSVTGPASFKMVFTTAAGGSMEQFYDLAEDPGATLDLAGAVASSTVPRGLHNSGIRVAGVNYNTGVNDTGAKLDLLEATTTRIRLRQESFYQNGPGGSILGGVKGYGDYSIQPSGRTALSWNRKITNLAGVPYTAEYHETMMHYLAGPSPLNFWTVYFDLAGAAAGTGNDDFSLAQNETAGTPGARTDFLNVLHKDWSTVNAYLASATLTDRNPQLSAERVNAYWYSGTGGTIPAAPTPGWSETWNFLTYFKPTNFTTNTDPNVVARSVDYRSPSPITLLKGQRWLDGTQNTGGGSDDFNEAEAAYVLTMDPNPGQGLQFRFDATTRYSPFLKIRRWRSFAESPTVTLDGATLTRDVDYKSDMKPLSRAHWASTLFWHCTMEGTTACDAGTLDVGSGTGGSTTGATVVPGKYGNGLLFMNNTDKVVGATTDFTASIGAIDFWYQPRSDSSDAARHLLWYWQSGTNPYNCITFEKTAGNLLLFSAIVGATNQACTIGGTTYSTSVSVAAGAFAWRAFDWVHLKTSWNSAGGLRKLRIAVNGVEAATSMTFVAPGGIGTPSFGGCNLSCPGAAGNANGILDEVSIYGGLELGGYDTNTPVAHGGLTSDAGEYLADPAKNWSLGLTPVAAGGKGSYFYFGSDSPFLGLNVMLQQPGVWQTTSGDLVWDYWDGAKWTSLESGFNFTDSTQQLTQNGTIYWDDPFNWSPYSVNGGPDLYYVRVHLAAGLLSYSSQPMERRITTDILLFQYCGSVTGPAPEFYFRAPVPTAVMLSSFTATPAARAVDLAWTTASEMQNLGFHLYRAEAAEGPYERITSSLIVGLGSSPVGRSYAFRDPGLVNGRTYYYELEDVETTGQTVRHGPVWATPGSQVSCCGEPSPVPPGPGPTTSPSGTRYGDPSSVELVELERTADHVLLELRTGGFLASPGDAGRAQLRVPGFESVSAPGEPSLPARRAWVEAVSGRRVRIAAVEPGDVVGYPGLRPSSETEPTIDVGEDGTVRAARRARAEGPEFRRSYPSQWARVEATAFQLETKKTELLLFPIRWTGAGVELARRLRVRLDFTGRVEGETAGGGSRGRRRAGRASADDRGVVAQLVVKERGLYRATYEDIYGTGPAERGVRVASLRLSRQGESVAFHVEPTGEAFGPGSSLYFLSEGSSLNAYGDAAYELETRGGGRRMTIVELPRAVGGVRQYWPEERREESYYYQPGLLNALDPWLWDVLVSPGSRSFRFEVRDLSRSGAGGRLHVALQGASDFEGVVDHHVRVRVNGTYVGETFWDGNVPTAMDLDLEPGVLREGTNGLELEDVGDAGAAYSMVFLDRFSVSYPRKLRSQGGTLEGRFESGGGAEIEGALASSVVVDTTDEPRWLRGATPTARGLAIPVATGRSYLVTSQVLRPTVRRRGANVLRNGANRADYLLIAPEAFLVAAAPLVALRESEGLRTKAVSVEEVYAEFGHGEAGPGGIQAFLEFAYHSWARPSPRYVLLLGDASYDPKDYLGTGVKDWIPGYPAKTSYLWTVSDPAYASVNGEDLLPDITIGRLPAGNVDEALRMVGKIIGYENGGGMLDGPAVLVADNSDSGGNFEADADALASGILASRNPEKIYYSVEGARTRARIRAAFDDGASLMSYVGHGGTAVWASENIFANGDVASLLPQSRQPFLMTMNCLNGFFTFPPLDSLSEALLKAEGRGVVGAFSPTGLSLDAAAHVYHEALLREIGSGAHERMGDAVLAAQESYARSGALPELLSIYHLLGDPALRIR